MATTPRIQTLVTEHATNNADSVSIETGTETLARLGLALLANGDTAASTLCGRLLAVYLEHGTDPDGNVSCGLDMELARLGYDTETVED